MTRLDISSYVFCLGLFVLVSLCYADKSASLHNKTGALFSDHKKTPTLKLALFSQNKVRTGDSDVRNSISPSERQADYQSASPPAPCYACILIPITAAAIAVSIAVPLANIAEVPNFNPNSIDVVNTQRRIPTNLATGISLTSFPDDGCGKTGVLFDDGNCYPLLRPCENPLFWTTVDPITLRGRCSPRLCGRQRVFVGQDQLCHDFEDALECTGGRRLYYSAYGDPICDCPIGQFPFPTEHDSCVGLFTQGPCPAGQVVSVSDDGGGGFGCAPAQCQTSQAGNVLLEQLVPAGDGACYPLGARGPCRRAGELLGYDVLEREPACVNVNDPLSPYSVEGDDVLDRTHSQQRSPDFGDFDVALVAATKRQETVGIFQFPTVSPTTLLNPCRPGPSRGNNYKCSNPLVPTLRRRELWQAVRSAFTCRGSAVLRAKGTCGGTLDASNCGPTYELGNASGRCEKSIV